jgi:hypothetical protein
VGIFYSELSSSALIKSNLKTVTSKSANANLVVGSSLSFISTEVGKDFVRFCAAIANPSKCERLFTLLLDGNDVYFEATTPLFFDVEGIPDSDAVDVELFDEIDDVEVIED